MSVDIHVKFYLNGKDFISSVYLNRLKTLLEGWSWIDELIPVFNDKVENPGKYSCNGQEYEYHGEWFNISSFMNAADKLKAEREKYTANLGRLNLIKNSVDYYKLDVEQSERLDSDISFNSDMVEELNDKIYVCQYMADTLYMMADMYGKSYDDYCMIFVYRS